MAALTPAIRDWSGSSLQGHHGSDLAWGGQGSLTHLPYMLYFNTETLSFICFLSITYTYSIVKPSRH